MTEDVAASIVSFVTCPACGGAGGATSPGSAVKCTTCQGAKAVLAEIADRYRRGQELRRNRIELGLTTVEAGIALNTTARTIAEVEEGRRTPTYTADDLRRAKERKGISR